MSVSSQRNGLGAKPSVIERMETVRVNIFGFMVNGSSSGGYKYLSPDMSQIFELLLDIAQR